MTIRTRRLTLVPCSLELARAELRSATELGTLLGAVVPDGWPPALYDHDAIRSVIALLESDPGHAGYVAYYFVAGDSQRGHTVVGMGGFKGKPEPAGTVELGYSILEAFRRQGFAAEAVAGMVDFAFRNPEVTAVRAETLPELEPSIGVLLKNGFRRAGQGTEPGVVRYELGRGDQRR